MAYGLSSEAVDKLLKDYSFRSILDIGCGAELEHSLKFAEFGKDVTSVDLLPLSNSVDKPDNINFVNQNIFDFIELGEKFECVWSSHCLEHLESPIPFLRLLKKVTNPDSIICITVPPLKHNIVSEHISLWNGGLLIYCLVLAGYDCSDIVLKKYGYNISVILKRKDIEVKTSNINELSKFFPEKYNYFNFNGDIDSINW
jgi:SAM-dependent methyltransferase